MEVNWNPVPKQQAGKKFMQSECGTKALDSNSNWF